MKSDLLEYKSIRGYLWIAAISSFLIGIVVIFGWSTDQVQISQINPTSPPMPLNTALCFTLCGLAVYFILMSQRALALTMSTMVFLFSGLMLIQYIFNISLVIDQIHINNIAYQSRTPPNTATCFFLMGISLIASCFTYKKNISFCVTILCGITAALAIITLFGYILGLYSVIGWYSFTGMSLLSSIGLIILSTCLFLAHSFLSMYKDKNFYGSLVGGIFIIFYLTFMLWEGSQTSRLLVNQKLSQNNADFIAYAIETSLKDTEQALNRIVLRWQTIGGYSKALWDTDSKSYLINITSLHRLSFYDSGLHLIYSRTRDNTSAPSELSTSVRRILNEQPLEMQHVLIENNLFLILPVISHTNEIEGFLLGEIEMGDVSDEAVPSLIKEFYDIEISNALIHSSKVSDWAVAKVNSPLIEWWIKVVPKADANANYLPYLILITGLIFATYMIWIVNLLQMLFRAKERVIRMMNEKSTASAYRQAILNSSAYSIIAVNPEGFIVVFNKAAEKLLQWKASEVIKKETPAIFHDAQEIEARAKELSEILGEKIAPGLETFTTMALRDQSDEREWTYIRKDGTRFPVQLSVTAVKDRHGKLIGFVGIAYDLTELKEVERMKKELIAITTHEIRSPLTSIKGALDLISAAETIHPKENQLVKIARSNCERLLKLTNDILDVQKMEAGKMDFFRKEIVVNSLFDKVIEINQIYAANHEVSLIKPKNVPECFIYADEDRILQVLTNFISNAVKNSPKGGEISFEVSIHDGKVRIGVKDQGPGIPEEFHDLLFQKFSQVPTERKTREGTGLGLTVCKSIIKEHSGKIGFNTSSEGSTFWFELPVDGLKEDMKASTLISQMADKK